MLTIGKKYFLLTKNKTVSGIRMQVVGIVNYTEAAKLPYSIDVLAVNEKVISDTSDDTLVEYFTDKTFYWCKDITNDTVYVLWDEIIDMTGTTMISAEYDYRMKINVGVDVDFTIGSVLEFIKTAVANEYGTKVQLVLESYGYDSSTLSDKEIFENQIKEYKSILETFKNLQPLTASLNKLITFDISGTYTKLSQQLAEIEGNIGSIASALG
jgi:hypothetical protein